MSCYHTYAPQAVAPTRGADFSTIVVLFILLIIIGCGLCGTVAPTKKK